MKTYVSFLTTTFLTTTFLAIVLLGFFRPASAADGNFNGIEDAEDVATSGGDCNDNGVPDDCDLLGIPVGVEFETVSTIEVADGEFLSGDFNANGTVDVVAHPQELNGVFTGNFSGSGDGSLVRVEGRTNLPASGLVKDIDNDGYADIVWAGRSFNRWQSDVQYGNGVFTFDPVSLDFSSGQVGGFTVGDMNNDGLLDVVVLGFHLQCRGLRVARVSSR